MWSNWSGIWINSSRLPKNKRIMIRRGGNWPRRIWHFWRGWRIIGRSIRRRINRMRMRPMRHVLITFSGSFWSIWRVRSAKVVRSSSRSLCLTLGLDWMNWRLMKSTARATVPSKFQHSWTISSPTSSKKCKKDTCTSAIRPSSARPSTTSADGSSSNASPTSAWSSTQYDERVIVYDVRLKMIGKSWEVADYVVGFGLFLLDLEGVFVVEVGREDGRRAAVSGHET